MTLQEEIHELSKKMLWKRLGATLEQDADQRMGLIAEALDFVEEELRRLDGVKGHETYVDA